MGMEKQTKICWFVEGTEFPELNAIYRQLSYVQEDQPKLFFRDYFAKPLKHI